jgi:spore maturation protein CgeB
VKIIVFGLSVSSSWGNGHATTYRALLAALHQRGHQIVFYEKDEEWYASNRDLPSPQFCELRLFQSWKDVLPGVRKELFEADVAILGSFFPDGIPAAQEILDSNVSAKLFFDIDTPITVAKLRAGGAEYLRADQISGFDLYLSFTAGPILQTLQNDFGARRARPFYCTFEPNTYYPRPAVRQYECDLSYMGTYAADRQAKLEELFLQPARRSAGKRLIVAGSQYPESIEWPQNVRHIRHLSPRAHPQFYSSSRLTLNLNRAHMVQWGFSPSVRLFEAAACGCPIVSDSWPGLENMFNVGHEILVAHRADEIIALLTDFDDAELIRIGRRARERVLAEHSSTRRAQEFEDYIAVLSSGSVDSLISPPTRPILLIETAPQRPAIASADRGRGSFEIANRARNVKGDLYGTEINLQNTHRSR